jgi:hypothetical protein
MIYLTAITISHVYNVYHHYHHHHHHHHHVFLQQVHSMYQASSLEIVI